ncbi:hypothetical protein [Streptacidiphilus jiangxiensis]|uniref:Uncharacterized protein n=1 Tax=Streptacidiphilus jiangxiensis TaxID=235985 RepID=A0A1H7RG58_STRJI|nr:hypothetical protein [Streptacidiphilus jiangxiensis]SEL59085.1 hypothetical protein SAMN05414137_110107 [Streptacidiphilus jiangxiensis]
MPSDSYASIAKILMSALSGRAWQTMHRSDVTDAFRAVTGEDRLTGERARLLAGALDGVGLIAYPPLDAISTADTFRLIRKGSLVHTLVALINNPSIATDPELARLVTKMKGKWDWGNESADVGTA